MAPPTPPPYGSGPANFANEGDQGPFSAFDNTINYQNMLRYQMVSQYNQSQATPYNLSMKQQRRMLKNPSYVYGVPGGQAAASAYYNRQAELNKHAYAGAVTTGALSMGAWSVASAASTVALGTGVMATFAAPLVLAAPIMPIVMNRVDEIMDRQKYMQSIALDLQMNRDRLGMRGLTYEDASAAGGNISSWMMDSKKSSFFKPEEMLRIQKVGISSGMLTSGGKASGTIGQYTKNVKDLIAATEDIVKTLQTTTDGALSMMKELNQSGFTTLPQIKNQVRMAKSVGGMTGMGFQNAAQIGAAGAMAAQGTPWNASVGASMFQMGAVAAHTISAASPRAAYAVERAGGVAQAGAIIAGAQMNILQSGIGTRMAAYAMNPNGTINEDRLKNMLSGRTTGYQVVSGANSVGYQMGQDRVRFGMFKQDMMNQLSDAERMGLTRQAFRMWGQGRIGSRDNKAWVFAGQYTNDANSQRVLYESLLGSSGFNLLEGEAAYNAALGAPASRMPTTSPALKKLRSQVDFIRQPVLGATDISYSMIKGGVNVMGDVWGGVAGGVQNTINAAFRPLAPYGVFDRSRPYAKDTDNAARFAYGVAYRGDMNQNITAASAIRAAGIKQKDYTIPTMETGVEAYQFMTSRTGAQTTEFGRMLASRIEGGTTADLLIDKNFLSYMGGKPKGLTKANSDMYARSLQKQFYDTKSALAESADASSTEYSKWYKSQKAPQQAAASQQYEEGMNLISSAQGYGVSVGNINGRTFIQTAKGYVDVAPEVAKRLKSFSDQNYFGKDVNIMPVSKTSVKDAREDAAATIKGALLNGAAWGEFQSYRVYNADKEIEKIKAESRAYSEKADREPVSRNIFRRAIQKVNRWNAEISYKDMEAGVRIYNKTSEGIAERKFGIDTSTPEATIESASRLEDIYQRGLAGAKLTPKEIAAKDFYTSSPPGAILKGQKSQTRREIAANAVGQYYNTLLGTNAEGLANQLNLNLAKGTKPVSVDQVTAFLLSPESVLKDENMMNIMREKTGLDTEGIRNLATRKVDGKVTGTDLISQLVNKNIQQMDMSPMKKAANAHAALAAFSEAGKSLFKLKEDVVVDGVVVATGGSNVKATRERLEAETKAADSGQMSALINALVGGGKGGNTTSVASPILNYWNNRWVL
ncbi:MAG TPA: hypothetical protein VMW42_09320 [Desulfatiglandales bacterium]|nr:hypothetical protein [Desulfatiglandales bacterium]